MNWSVISKKISRLFSRRSVLTTEDRPVLPAVREWAIILSVSLVLVGLSAWYSMDRFDYWANLEAHLPPAENNLVLYDSMSLKAILETLDEDTTDTASLPPLQSAAPAASDANTAAAGPVTSE